MSLRRAPLDPLQFRAGNGLEGGRGAWYLGRRSQRPVAGHVVDLDWLPGGIDVLLVGGPRGVRVVDLDRVVPRLRRPRVSSGRDVLDVERDTALIVDVDRSAPALDADFPEGVRADDRALQIDRSSPSRLVTSSSVIWLVTGSYVPSIRESPGVTGVTPEMSLSRTLVVGARSFACW